MADPEEGVGPDGFIVTGADRSNLRLPFLAAIDDAAEMCRHRCSAGFGLYVYGSVATGRAQVGASDLDLLLVVVDASDLEQVSDVAPRLTERYVGVVREVALATATEDEVLAPTPDGYANRCFLKHYCVSVLGRDLTVDLPRCRPSAELAAGFAADTSEVLAGIERALEDASATDVDVLARTAARKLSLTCAAIVSIRTGGWTTDRRRGTEELARARPDRAPDLRRALRWSEPAAEPGADRNEVETFVRDFGTWVLATLDEVREASGG